MEFGEYGRHARDSLHLTLIAACSLACCVSGRLIFGCGNFVQMNLVFRFCIRRTKSLSH